MYNHVWVLFKPAGQVLALTWDDICVQLQLVDSVPFQSLFGPVATLFRVSLSNMTSLLINMYNHVWVSFKPCSQSSVGVDMG